MYFRRGNCIRDLVWLELSRLDFSHISKALKLKTVEFRQSAVPMWGGRMWGCGS